MVKEQHLRYYIAEEIMEQPFHIPTYYADHITVDIFKAVLQDRKKIVQIITGKKNDEPGS